MRRAAGFLLAVSLFLLALGFANAGSREGVEAFNLGDYHTAFRGLLPLAVAGDSSAQVFLGLLNLEGWGLPQDYAEAVRWFRLAADQGDPAGQFSIGATYAGGLGVPQDHVLANGLSLFAFANRPTTGHNQDGLWL